MTDEVRAGTLGKEMLRAVLAMTTIDGGNQIRTNLRPRKSYPLMALGQRKICRDG